MPTYYDKKTKTWFCRFYYTDYKGEKKQKKKRGFKLQREAKEFERHFLEQQSTDLNMSFENFVKLYNAYKALGGNSFIDKIYEEIKTWEVIT